MQGVTSRWQLFTTTGAFLIWTYTLGDAYEKGAWTEDLHQPEIASVLLLLFTGIAPLFFPRVEEAV